MTLSQAINYLFIAPFFSILSVLFALRTAGVAEGYPFHALSLPVIFLIFLILFNSFILYKNIYEDGISFRVIFWYYNWLFLGVAPTIQIIVNEWRYGFQMENFNFTFLLIILSQIFFTMFYWVGSSTASYHARRHLVKLRMKNIMFVAVVFSLIIALFLINYEINISASIVRTVMGNTYSPLENILEFLFRPFLFFVFSFTIIARCSNLKSKHIFVAMLLLFCCVSIVMNPISGARSVVFFLYLGLLISVLRGRLQKFSLIFSIGLPFSIFFSEFQNLVRGYFLNNGEIIFSGRRYFFQGHFDGFEQIGHTISYVDLSNFSFGHQALGALAFWIPRSVWVDKPFGSGDFISLEYIALSFDRVLENVSMPLLGEAYLNFGVVGVVAVYALVGFICGRADRKFKGYALNSVTDYNLPLWVWMYVFSVGWFLFLLRGDLQSSIAMGAGLATSLLFAWIISHRVVQRHV